MRRHNIHELTNQHGSTLPHGRTEVPAPNLPPSPPPHSPTHGRSHHHQRIGPGVHLHRQQKRDPEVTRQLMREREKEKERDHERELDSIVMSDIAPLRKRGTWQGWWKIYHRYTLIHHISVQGLVTWCLRLDRQQVARLVGTSPTQSAGAGERISSM